MVGGYWEDGEIPGADEGVLGGILGRCLREVEGC